MVARVSCLGIVLRFQLDLRRLGFKGVDRIGLGIWIRVWVYFRFKGKWVKCLSFGPLGLGLLKGFRFEGFW